MIGIVVEDMEKAIDFYRLLGFEIPDEHKIQDHVEVITENGYRIAWDKASLMSTILPNWIKPIGQGLTLAFKIDSPQDVDVLVNTLRANGYKIEKEPWDAFWGQRYAIVKDPDGNNVDLFAALKQNE